MDSEEVGNQLSDAAKTIASGVHELAGQVRSGLKGLNLSESTVPNTFRNFPKLISPRVHLWLDTAVTAYFCAVGFSLARRRNKGAATAAFINAGMVATVSLLTDYQGTGEKPISFKMHATLDAVQATTAALAPILQGFAGEPESAFFYGQAGNELAVIATTDWDAGMRASGRGPSAT
jgi:hypothetical protein